MKQRQTLTKRPRYPAGEVRPSQPASDSSTVAPNADDVARHDLIAMEAYLLAERRGFAPGAELDDWLAAEAIVAERLRTGVGLDGQEQRELSHH